MLALLLALTVPVMAQSEQAPVGPIGPIPSPTVSLAQWDILFDYDVTTPSGQGSLAGAVHLDTTFWAAVWNEDTIAVFNNDGTFVEDFTLPALFDAGSGFIRAMTWDGTSVWAANNTTTIHEIDPVTKTVINSVITASADPIRFLTYDPSADGGNGGFWMGNFNTPISLISRTGNILTTIPATTHQLGGMYGAAYDGTSAGGPYLWVFHQAGDPSNGLITQLDLTMGVPTGAGRDVNQDLNTPDALAGGMFVTNRWDDEGTLILGGISQATPDRLFGYELSFDPAAAIDLATQSLSSPVSGCGLSNTETVIFELVNRSSSPVSNVPVEVLVNNVVVATEMVAGPLMPNIPFTYTFTETIDISTAGLYNIGVRTSLDGDINNSNDLTTVIVASKTIVTPTLSQDFDGLTEGTMDLPPFYNLGDILFEVSPGPTVSTNTGPAVDASGSGNFIYMESSGSLPLDRAILSTECIDLTGADEIQLGFAYHLFGAAIGDLIIRVSDQNGNSSIIDFISGQQQATSDAPWEERSVSLANFAGEIIEINIEGNVADNGESAFNSDIALDEILLRTCAAPMIDAEVTNLINNNPGSIDLTVMGTGTYTYEWSNGATTEDLTNLIPDMYSVTITADNECVYIESYEIINACTGYTAEATVVDDMQSTGVGSIDLTVTGGTAPYSYLWSNGAITEDLANLVSGPYSVEVMDDNGCIFNGSYDVGDVTSIDNIDGLQQLDISPNPTEGQLQVALEMEQMAEVQLTVFNAIGQQVYATKSQTFSQHTYHLNLSDQSSGMYWISLRINDKVVTRSINLK